MATAEHLTSGNLALAMHGEAFQPAEAPARRQVSRRRPSCVVVSGTRQILPADAHASTCARRGRPRAVALKCLVAGLLLAVFLGGSLAITVSQERARAQLISSLTFTEVTVASGDSLWSLAREHSVDGLTTSETIEVIRSSNDLSTSELHVGTVLLVPDTA